MRKEKGFTLIELLAVIVILAIITLVAVPKILDVIELSKESAAESSIKLVKDAIRMQTTTESNLISDENECYNFNFDDQTSGNTKELKLKNKEKIKGTIKYCNGKFYDDTLKFDEVEITKVNDFYPVKTGLSDYFDYSDFKNNEWKNSISSGNNIEFSGNGELTSDGVKIDMKNKNVFATLPIDNTKNNITIYLVAKAMEDNSNNARLIEIPKNPSGSQSHTTPCVFISSSKIGYGIFLSDKKTSISSNNFNVIALQINMDSKELKININNEYTGTISGLNGFGDTLYLSKCTYNKVGYGNNIYKMISVSYSAHSDEEISKNVTWLTNKYIK